MMLWLVHFYDLPAKASRHEGLRERHLHLQLSPEPNRLRQLLQPCARPEHN